MGVAGGQALVEKMMGEGGVLGLEGPGEGLGFCGLRAGRAVGMEGVADDESRDVVLADEAGDGFEVGAECGAVEGEERLGGEAERVGDGETDAAVTDVEREDARGGHGGSVRGGT